MAAVVLSSLMLANILRTGKAYVNEQVGRGSGGGRGADRGGTAERQSDCTDRGRWVTGKLMHEHTKTRALRLTASLPVCANRRAVSHVVRQLRQLAACMPSPVPPCPRPVGGGGVRAPLPHLRQPVQVRTWAHGMGACDA